MFRVRVARGFLFADYRHTRAAICPAGDLPINYQIAV
jgi:hypothetical protein